MYRFHDVHVRDPRSLTNVRKICVFCAKHRVVDGALRVAGQTLGFEHLLQVHQHPEHVLRLGPVLEVGCIVSENKQQ